ncbi:MAG TPA: glycoside hydrolase family 32 protein [Silvibacterium sp.]|nr:glycoside hydrolase family 32 protein [Silvibacterium sp.]
MIWGLLLGGMLVAQTNYQEPYRPQVHFSPRQHWTNDPNGLVYFHGEYHLFFQFNPEGDEWGHMSWGHAVSKDLLHWRELPVAIPEQGDEMVFTGSVVVDRNNTSGFCGQGKECLVAIYTGHRHSPGQTRQTQNLAYSLDDGRTWIRYAQNPVLDLHLPDFRDPSVSWDEKEGHWRMAVSLPSQHKVRFYASPDLKHWTELSDFGPAGAVGGAWECPDLLQIPGESGTPSMWVLKVGLNPGSPQGGSGEQYFLGQFDGKRFVPSESPGSHGWTNYGKDDYCAISFNGIPPTEKPVLMGWMNNWQYAAQLPTSPWRGQMSLPRRLSLVHDQDGLSIRQDPVIDALHGEHAAIQRKPHGEIAVQEAPFEIDLRFEEPLEQAFGIRLYTDQEHWTEIGFDRSRREFYMDRTMSGKDVSRDFPGKTVGPLAEGRPFDLRVIVDWSSVEAYAQGDTIAMTNLIFPSSKKSRIVLFASGKSVAVSGDVWSLRSIWNVESQGEAPDVRVRP